MLIILHIIKMRTFLITSLFLVICGTSIRAQHFHIPNISAFDDSLEFITSINDEEMRLQRLDGFWDSLKAHNMIPYTYQQNAVFLYRSENEVTWNGDFNNWGNTPFLFAERLSGTDLWLAKVNFPSDARLDYKNV